MSSIYEAHPDYLSSKRWQTIRRWRLRRDRNRCVICHADGPLDIHHGSYDWFDKAWWFGRPIADDCPWWMLPEIFYFLRWLGMRKEEGDSVALCKPCHGAVHKGRPIEAFRKGVEVKG